MVYRLVVGLLAALCGVGSATPAAAQKADPAKQKVEPPKKIKNVEPVYPASAQSARVQGNVVIEATVGTDGKVTGARVVKSVPLLDEAALAAVRQWEYTPATADGTPVAVVMTVTVGFSLKEAAPPGPSRTGPLVLDRDGTDWTVAGTPLLDNDLRFWLHDVMRTEPQKELYYHAPPTGTYGELVDVLSSAIAAGVERLHLFVGEAAPAEAVRVWLEPVAEKIPTLTLPVSDVASQVSSAGLPVSISRGGATTTAKAAVQRAASGSVVHVRVDRSRKVSDLWGVMQLGAARQVEGFALGVQLPPGAAVAANAPVTAQQQRDWKKVSDAIAGLVLSDKKSLDDSIAESIPILEKFVARNPNVLEGQFKLASAYEARAERTGATAEARRRDLENAARHFAVLASVDSDVTGQFVSTLKLMQLYEPEALNDAVKARRYAQRLVDEHPSESMAHMYYARMLHDAGDLGGAVSAMRHGRTVSTMPLVGLAQSLQYLVEYLQARRDLPPAAVRDSVQEMIGLSDAILGSPEKTDQDSQLAAMGRSMALDTQAERLAETSAERVSLLVESDRWFESVRGGKVSPMPPAPKLSPTEAAELECRALGRWSNVVADAQPLAVAIPAVQQYAKAQPACLSPRQKLVELMIRRGRESADPAARTADLQAAVDQLVQIIDVAPQPLDRMGAFTQVAELAGPGELNRPERVASAARTLLKRASADSLADYSVAEALFRSGRTDEGEQALRAARSAVKATPVNRARMVRSLVELAGRDEKIPEASARRLFDEAGALLNEAEKMKGGKDEPAVMSARIAWLNLSADHYEKDPARAAAQREQVKQLQARLREIK